MRRTRSAIFIHLIWGTWDRLPLLTGDIERDVYRAIEAKCAQLDTEIVALGGVEDHVHLLVRLPAMLSVADLVKHVKGASSHLATHRLAPDQFFKWQGAYAAFSVSLRHLTAVESYVREQKTHHAAGSLIGAWEMPNDNDGNDDDNEPSHDPIPAES